MRVKATTEGSLSRGDFCFLCPRFIALFLYNLGTGVGPSSAVAVPLMVSLVAVGAAAARGLSAWLLTSSSPWSLGSRWHVCSSCSWPSWAKWGPSLSLPAPPLVGIPGGHGKSSLMSGISHLRILSWSTLNWILSFVWYSSPLGLIKILLREAQTYPCQQLTSKWRIGRESWVDSWQKRSHGTVATSASPGLYRLSGQAWRSPWCRFGRRDSLIGTPSSCHRHSHSSREGYAWCACSIQD